MKVTSITLEGEITPNSKGIAHLAINSNTISRVYRVLYNTLYKINNDLIVMVITNPELQQFGIIYSLSTKKIKDYSPLTAIAASALGNYNKALNEYLDNVWGNCVDEKLIRRCYFNIRICERDLFKLELSKFLVENDYLINSIMNIVNVVPVKEMDWWFRDDIVVDKDVVDDVKALNEYLDNKEQEDN